MLLFSKKDERERGMTMEKFAFYGYDRNTYKNCIDLIHWTNRRHVGIINLWFLVVNLVYLLFSTQDIFGVNEKHTAFYGFFVIISAALEAALFFARPFIRKISMQLVYVMMFMLFAYGILASLNQPYMAATMFQVLIVLVSVAFIDTMFTVGGAVFFFCIVFQVSSYLFKPVVIFYQDMYNTVVFLSLALVLHYASQRARISQFVTHRENVQIQHDLVVQSDFDTLTELLGRGAFFKMADKLVSQKTGELLVICLLDLDGFKAINDTYGHQVGDRAIQKAGEIIGKVLSIEYGEKWCFTTKGLEKKTSFAGRLGGDEFICLLRGYDEEGVKETAERLLAELNAARFDPIEGLRASIGLSVITEDDRNLDGPYHRADDALYESKRGGKNRITYNNKYKRWRETC